ncbi:MAG: hypothetical protein A3A43_00770 [Candidatus Liptonbacteria bacterium RIFCSPLOWO2_01_FULL_56_20]|uniref:Type 4 fimbrial biogenesis protein PilX N-terminal domain-containing protein n=1 Tax=Candidatus Liptonbacteria bacterium RIFCSPLOWO2_01_FULL_56_20 TaxID=1798652 RepID=A0A1G2CIY6_9BACT|nr:MAG: hypothetical protein UY96_C0020G0020 [Parcubacteria group bacterium GW2011_GWB1_56_8]OGY98329.1 MAG: hypothetical protein A2681_01385 [Candidatus Liptonbacteria bacterium RIFCSPHIGHO2_01_FULL_56_18b]OGZ00710.1 MAG: hypothetical protein A3A43_00770 [Candidatus Liptonbacteria bacterium RIFCSPLOWO2_01_FULL_56_20]
MILAVLALGGAILGATTIAGLLMVYEVRQASDLNNSAKAVFAADAGIEWGLYQFFNPSSTNPRPTFGNNATSTTSCYDAGDALLPDCRDEAVSTIRARGSAGNVSRAFELTF